MLSQLTGLPARFVRKEAKTYGTCRLAEGGELDGQRLCIVEDVVTSGGAILDAAVELRARGAVLGPVICVIDRESGGTEKLAAEGLVLHPLFRMHELTPFLSFTPHFAANVRWSCELLGARLLPSEQADVGEVLVASCRIRHFAASGATPAATS